MSKPVVRIKNVTMEKWEGPRGTVHVLHGVITGHPHISDGAVVGTSRIVQVETLNTVYILEDDDAPEPAAEVTASA